MRGLSITLLSWGMMIFWAGATAQAQEEFVSTKDPAIVEQITPIVPDEAEGISIEDTAPILDEIFAIYDFTLATNELADNEGSEVDNTQKDNESSQTGPEAAQSSEIDCEADGTLSMTLDADCAHGAMPIEAKKAGASTGQIVTRDDGVYLQVAPAEAQ
ncbi:hypothetical protein [uncultured Roseovarius sp.]|uniref:hypothetical protein n=1 Tax=uncultured Roseovarius sp. TaxID=293344 RepID=UPI0025D50B4C|nr:hypothetical protein [uncultured Roseovarius sp.]